MTTPNPELQLANDFVQYSNCNIFLTGKAGTGKTTFLQNLKKNTPKRIIVTAPTGVAAINAGGVTLHSFFQMPFGPFVPGSEAHSQSAQRKFSKEKINIIRSLDLLIIDEISMVRADLLDGVDSILRRYKNRDLPFGGVQLLMIGDLHQLSPVVRDEEWNILRPYYATYYFFSSNALQQTHWVPIELKHIYRQSDAHFIDLLNCVRNNQLDAATLNKLNSRYIEKFKPSNDDNYITLTTHNKNADVINESQLAKLGTKAMTFSATIHDNYPGHIYPTAEQLVLKKGAQVMFVRNDSSGQKCYFNGKVGKITHLDKHQIRVKCPDDEQPITVDRVTWENIKYTINERNKEITEEVIGEFTQFPLRLAWAITIHKSQGMTFERAIIDANAAFAHGQVYVALSRCKTFEGMVLSTPIALSAVKTDGTIAQFVQHTSQNSPTQEQLNIAKITYQQKLLQECFDYQDLRFNFEKLSTVLLKNKHLIESSDFEDMHAVKNQIIEEIATVSDKFKRQLHNLFASDKIPQQDPYLQERVQKASHYFLQKLQQGPTKWIASCTFTTDNSEVRKKIQQAFAMLQRTLFVKTACMHSCRESFSPTAYLHALATAEIKFNASTATNKPANDNNSSVVENSGLLQILRQWRAEKARQEELEHYRIIHQRVLIEIASALPASIDALLEINGIGKHTAEKYGAQLLQLVLNYAQNNNIELNQSQHAKKNIEKQAKKPKKALKINTKQISYDLYLEGNNIIQIATQRELVSSTIENHLAYYIGIGALKITDFIDKNKLAKIIDKFSQMGVENLKEIKNELGDLFSYGELQMVKKHLACEKNTPEN